MVEILHCDSCGIRMPLGHPPGEPCGSCGFVMLVEVHEAAPSARRRQRPSTRDSSRRTPTKGRGGRAQPAAASPNTIVFVIAAVVGVVIALLSVLLLRGEPKATGSAPARTSAPATDPAPAPAPSTGPAPAVSVFRTDLESPPPPPSGGTDDKGESDGDFFANLRAESEGRRQAGGEARAPKRGPFEEQIARSVAQWDSAWKISGCINTPHMPRAQPREYLGRPNVLTTHPRDPKTPCALTRSVDVPASGRTELVVTVAAHDKASSADWLLRVFVDDKLLGDHTVAWVNGAQKWQTFRFDLNPHAGRTVKLRLENAAAGRWAFELGVWAEARVVTD